MENKSIDLELYCITNKRTKFLENTSYKLCWVGSEKAPDNYLKCNSGINIFSKEKYYSELTFQYWYWKNMLDLNNKKWIGFCQKRRFWVNTHEVSGINKLNLNEYLIKSSENDWENFDAVLCSPISVHSPKKIKMIKRGWKNILKDPSILYEKKKTKFITAF